MGKKNFQYGLFIKKNLTGALLIAVLAGASVFSKDLGITGDLAIQDILPFSGESLFRSQQKLALNFQQDISEQEYRDMQEYQTPHYITTVGGQDVIMQPETDASLLGDHSKIDLTAEDLEKLKDINYLKKMFYIVDKRTDLTQEDFSVEKFLEKDLRIDNTAEGPKILIFHTHSSEMYADSDPSNLQDGVIGAGEYLAKLLEERYGIETLHHTGRYDVVDGKGQVLGAYERMEPDIRKILSENPSIQMVIDLHRDGVAEGTRLVSTVNGKQCAQIMFFNGLCKLNKNGTLSSIEGLTNPYLEDNLALSFQMQLLANELYPGFTRKIYVNAYRYSLHMLPRSMLIEVGAQTNTKEEAFNAMEPLAQLLYEVLLGKE